MTQDAASYSTYLEQYDQYGHYGSQYPPMGYDSYGQPYPYGQYDMTGEVGVSQEEEGPAVNTATARCTYYDEGRCRHGDGCYYYHPGRFRSALTDPALERVEGYVVNAVQCASRLAEPDGMIVLKYMRDLFLEDINEVQYMSTDTIDDVMAEVVGAPYAYEVPWYRTVPLKTFLQLVCLKIRNASWHMCLQSCVLGKCIHMVAIHATHISVMMDDGTKWVLSKAQAGSPEASLPAEAWCFGKEQRYLDQDFTLASPCMSKTYLYRRITKIWDPTDPSKLHIDLSDERPYGMWVCQKARGLRRLKLEIWQTVCSFFAPAELLAIQVPEPGGGQAQLHVNITLHPHI